MISLISTLGVTVGVMARVIALALMTGLQGELRDRIVGSNPHIYVLEGGRAWSDYRRRRWSVCSPCRTSSAPRPSAQGKAIVQSAAERALR